MLNQAFHLTPGLTSLVAVIERTVEPGQARQYWDGTANAWAPMTAQAAGAGPSTAPHLPIFPDPNLPGIYLLLVPTSVTSKWPDAIYRVTLLNLAITTGDQVVSGPDSFLVAGGDDAGLGYPSAIVPWLGGVLQVYGARLFTPSLPPST